VILGLGIDVLEVARMERDLKDKDGLADNLFTPSEIAYCRSKRYPAQHFAARFTAKEALFKALGTGQRGTMAFQQIEILNDDQGKPRVTLSGKVKEVSDNLGVERVHVSMSHTKEYAVAVIVLEK
jgi:holo-[acyl-carrier protein] synthase